MSPSPRRSLLLVLGGFALVLVVMGVAAGDPGTWLRAVAVLLTSGPLAALWLSAAAGFGWPLRAAVGTGRGGQLALGVAALFLLDAGLGRLGLLTWGGTAAGWIVLAAGCLLLVEQLRRRPTMSPGPTSPDSASPWAVWIAAPALAVLLLASCSAPGWLWESEFGGYDALSYHLQLPKEWMDLGRITTLDHNVYASLPSYAEGAYLHLALITGDAVNAAYACQLLHAGMAIATAVIVGAIAARHAGRVAGTIATVILLGTPWVIVVGSLAYNEMAVALLLAGGLLLVFEDAGKEVGGEVGADVGADVGGDVGGVAPRAAAIGLLAGAACGAKLTAAGFVAVPLLVLCPFALRSWSRRAVAGVIAGSAALLTLTPYLVGNTLATGNPVFPFLSGVLGLGHWTAEQAAIFAAGHAFDGGVGARLAEGWHQLLRYGIGPNADPAGREPWRPQWSLLPWITIVAGLVALRGSRTRRAVVLLLLVIAGQAVFWLVFTHIKSRFMVPAVVPAAIITALGVASLASAPRRAARIGLVVAGVAWCTVPFLIFRLERDHAPTAAVDAIMEMGAASPLYTWIDTKLDDDAVVLLVGDATPFYLGHRGVVYQTTWDRGPMSRAIRAADDDDRAVVEDLREQGITHVLVDETMLLVWETAGWNDPMLTRDRVVRIARTQLEPVQGTTHGRALFRIPTGRSP